MISLLSRGSLPAKGNMETPTRTSTQCVRVHAHCCTQKHLAPSRVPHFEPKSPGGTICSIGNGRTARQMRPCQWWVSPSGCRFESGEEAPGDEDRGQGWTEEVRFCLGPCGVPCFSPLISHNMAAAYFIAHHTAAPPPCCLHESTRSRCVADRDKMAHAHSFSNRTCTGTFAPFPLLMGLDDMS